MGSHWIRHLLSNSDVTAFWTVKVIFFQNDTGGGGDDGDEIVGSSIGDATNKDTHSIKAPLHLAELPNASQNISLVCKRERSDDCPFPCMDNSEPVSLVQNKMSKHNDPNSSQANGSEDSTTTTQDLFVSTTTATTTTTNCSSALLEFPLFESIEPKENHPNNTLTFDAANLEKSVPPGYLKFISNLETEILNVSMERETLKIEVMRAQAMINILQTRIDLLNKENEDLRRVVPDVYHINWYQSKAILGLQERFHRNGRWN
ncbi:hypothetical protein HYC85_013989 [Camellia sinensis]|uniref:Uncharacterized protein n=1 Tax=Camellia sinensis TaxID=4442 RepID=A0A7J7H4Y8_CAMSI|nr:hypothetical protein HYC85_013989 [Camellia sinensis]